MDYGDFKLFIYPSYVFQYKNKSKEDKFIKLTEMEGEILSILMGRRGHSLVWQDISKLIYYGVVGPYSPQTVINTKISILKSIFAENGIKILIKSRHGNVFRIFEGFELQEPKEKAPKRPGRKPVGVKSFHKDITNCRRKVVTRKEKLAREERRARWNQEFTEKRRALAKESRKKRLKLKKATKPLIRSTGVLNPPSPPRERPVIDADWHFPARHSSCETGKWDWKPPENGD